MRRFIVPVTVLCGIGLGYWLGRSANMERVADPEKSLNDAMSSGAQQVGSLPESEGQLQLADTNARLFQQYASYIDFIEQAQSHEAFVALAEGLEENPIGKSESQVPLLILRWVEVDAEGCFAYIQAYSGKLRFSYLEAFFETMAEVDVDQALAWATQLEAEQPRNYALKFCLERIAQEDATKAAELGWKYFGGNAKRVDWMLFTMFEKWAQTDAAGAGQRVLELEEGLALSLAIQGVLAGMAETQPEAAYAWINSIPQTKSVQDAKAQWFQKLVNRDFDQAKLFLSALPDVHSRMRVLDGSYWGNAMQNNSQHLADIFTWLGTVATGRSYEQKATQLIHSIMESDPLLATKLANEMPYGSARSSCLQAVAVNLLSQSPIESLEFATGMEDPQEKDKVLMWMESSLRNGGGERIAQWVLASEDVALQRRLSEGLAQGWAKYDQGAALTWAEQLQDPSAKQNALRAVCDIWMQTDPGQTIEYIESSVNKESRSKFYKQAFGNWAWSDPASAAQALTLLVTNDDSATLGLYATVSQHYMHYDSLGASKWVDSLEPGLARDNAVDQVVGNVVGADPAAGFTWSLTIEDPKIRRKNLELSVQQWLLEDVDAVAEVLQKTELSGENKSVLNELLVKAQARDG